MRFLEPSQTPGPRAERPWLVSPRGRLLTALILTVVAITPRYYNLGELGFSGDEDLTALAARSTAGSLTVPVLPSGMSYMRALPFTWATGIASKMLGDEKESSYRAVAAAFGAATPAAVFLTGTAFVSPHAALVAGTMVALSGYHIEYSRYARMYAPFVFFFVLASFFLWRWAHEGGVRNFALAALTFGAAAWLHLLGLLALQFGLLGLVFRRGDGPRIPTVILSTAALAVLTYLLNDMYVGEAYGAFSLPRDVDVEGSRTGAASGGVGSSTPLPLLLAAVAAGLLGFVAGARELRHPDPSRNWIRSLGILGAWTAVGGFIGAGHLWAAAQAGLVLLLLLPGSVPEMLWKHRVVAGLLGAVAIGWVGGAVLTMGLAEGIRRLVLFPFPNVVLLFERFPEVVVLFGCAALWLLATRSRSYQPGLCAVVAATVLTTAALGVAQSWTPVRYLLPAYPYMVLAAAAFLVHATTWVVSMGSQMSRERTKLGTTLATLAVVALPVGGHGVAAAVREASAQPGDLIDSITMRPDHRGPGLYVRERIEPGDIVISEHPDTQILYAGQVDYWFREASDARARLFLAEDGEIREHYVGARLLPTVRSIDAALRAADGRAWLITSGETFLQKEIYLSEAQIAWLDELEQRLEPEFVGADGVSKVYCLNCQ